MNKINEQIFKNKKLNSSKLLKYGFTSADNTYSLYTEILDNQFGLTVKITETDIETEVTDLATDEPYTLFLVSEASGSFVGAVRSAYQEVMSDIAKNCFDEFVFKSECTQSVIKYVSETYGDSLEFLWEKFTDNAVWRRKDNRKWYAAILTVSRSKLGFPSDEKIEVIDLRYDHEEIDKIIANKKIFGGYHMNKKHWITICLDGSVELAQIQSLIDNSYKLAKK